MSAVGRYRLMGAYKELMARWERSGGQWGDAARQEFYKSVIEPLEPRMRTAVSGMEKLAEAMATAERDCR